LDRGRGCFYFFKTGHFTCYENRTFSFANNRVIDLPINEWPLLAQAPVRLSRLSVQGWLDSQVNFEVHKGLAIFRIEMGHNAFLPALPQPQGVPPILTGLNGIYQV
jgi:hypothetical protein